MGADLIFVVTAGSSLPDVTAISGDTCAGQRRIKNPFPRPVQTTSGKSRGSRLNDPVSDWMYFLQEKLVCRSLVLSGGMATLVEAPAWLRPMAKKVTRHTRLKTGQACKTQCNTSQNIIRLCISD